MIFLLYDLVSLKVLDIEIMPNNDVFLHDNSMYPLISVVIPTYNRPDLVDDHSDEAVRLDILNLKKRYQFRFYTSPGQGACAARNYGIHQATGEYITGLDDDDRFTPKRLAIMYKEFEPRFSFIAARTVDFTGTELPTVDEDKGRSRIVGLKQMLSKNHARNQVLTLKQRLLSVGAFDEKFKARQDYDLWVRLVKQYGPAKIIYNRLYYLNKTQGLQRISASRKRTIGCIQFYRKHNKLMSCGQRLRHLKDIFKQAGRYPGPVAFYSKMLFSALLKK